MTERESGASRHRTAEDRPARALRTDLFRVAGGDGWPHLLISVCSACGARSFPPRRRCSRCSQSHLEIAEAPCEGLLYSYTIVRELPGRREGFEPYALGQVDLAEDLRVTGVLLRDFDAIAIGMPVRTTPRPMGAGDDASKPVGWAFESIEERS